MTARLPILPAAAIEEVARSLRITDHRTGTTAPWVPNAEQRALWRASERAQRDGRWLFAGKPRQIGATTAVQLEDLLWTATADGAGHRVRCGLITQTEDKTRERAAIATEFVRQLRLAGGLEAECNTERVTFPGGSEFEFVTAGGKGLGRSGSYQRLHLTELPWWPEAGDPIGSVLATLSLDGFVAIDTTSDLTAPQGIRTRGLWQARNRYDKLFFSVEMHEEYRLDAATITDDEWRRLQELGFTIREAAAWWLNVAVRDLCSGDEHRAMREFPQLESHMFSMASGLFIPRPPTVRDPLRIEQIGDTALAIYREPADTSGQTICAVDTSGGKGRDRHAIVVIDKRDEAPCAVLADNTLTLHELARAVHRTWALYTRSEDVPLEGIRRIEPEVVIEEDGIGEATVQEARRLGVPVIPHDTTEASKIDGLLLARASILAGRQDGPEAFAEEASELHQDELGRWKGRKDAIMALGMALIRLRVSPYRPPAVPPGPPMVRPPEHVRRRMQGRVVW